MRNSTLIHIEKDGKWLMMHRIKKKNDENHDKWVGIGGKFLEGESPYDCAIREAYEETGLTLKDIKLNGIITFVSDIYGTEYMFLYTCSDFQGELKECDEGNLEWIKKEETLNLPVWEGDKLFINLLLNNSPFFEMKLIYQGDILVDNSVVIY